MRTKVLFFALLMVAFFSCEKEEKDDTEKNKTTIDGEDFSPTDLSVVNTGESFVLTFTEGTKKVEITTNDTIAGTYEITTSALKSTTLFANLSYTDGTTIYTGTSGNVTITSESDTVISGTYSATVISDEEVEMEISSGTFTELTVVLDVEEETPPVTEASINDTLSLCYNDLENFVEFSFLFDAVYSNTATAPSTTWDNIYAHSQTTTNEKVNQFWNEGFDIILKSNFILEEAEGVIADSETRNAIVAQAKAIRAYVYYTLFTWYGELPLIMVYEPESWARSTKEEVLYFIKADANAAILDLPLLWAESESYKVTKAFIQGLLCRVLLNNSEYNAAFSLAKEIVSSGQYELDATVDNITSPSSEIYWGFDEGDNEEFNLFFTKGTYVPAIRYTETMVVLAEAAYNLGQQMEALNAINMLKYRRGETEIMTIENATVFNQWQLELEQEGSVFNTLKRYSLANSELGIEDYRLVLPIPQSVIDSYPDMFQNPGY